MPVFAFRLNPGVPDEYEVLEELNRRIEALRRVDPNAGMREAIVELVQDAITNADERDVQRMARELDRLVRKVTERQRNDA